jgi:exopolyphosphatase/guanosine-5'-triphosphate,3'-diphosphate pyrophosphatase
MSIPGKKVAVIDIGSHSILLLAGESKPDGKIGVLDQQFRTAKLAEGMDHQNCISEAAMDRIMRILRDMNKSIGEFDIQEVYPIGTAGLRKASNTAELKKRIKDSFNWDLKIITDREEAELNFIGAITDYNDEQKQFLVMDVGGGSTEFALGFQTNLQLSESIDIGAVVLAKKMKFQEILCSSDRLGIMNLIMLEIQKIKWLENINADCQVIGTGGTITTLAAIKSKMANYDPELIGKTSFGRDEIWELYYNLNEQTLAERKKITGLDEGREHVIIYGMLIFLTFMQMKQIDIIRVSDKGLRFGYMKSIFTGALN